MISAFLKILTKFDYQQCFSFFQRSRFYTDFRGLCRRADIGNAIDIISKIKMSKCVRIEVLEVTGLGWACHAQIVYDFYL